MADNRVPVNLSGAAATMLATLYLKALDSKFDRPVLGDRYAAQVVDRISAKWAPLITVRTAQYDIWTRQFLAVNPHCTVVHLGCGLDSRVFRLDPGPGVEWYDVDYPEVIALRAEVYPSRPGYHLVAASATDPSLFDRIRADRPVLLIAEGISMYLTECEGIALLRRVVERFRSGELQVDFYSGLGIKTQKAHTLVRRTGSTLYWGVNSPDDVVSRVPGIRLLVATTLFDADTLARASAPFRLAGKVVRAAPPVRRALQYHRYAFGRVN
jgi:O-methyltransferase involved in polyketide biosynthesis